MKVRIAIVVFGFAALFLTFAGAACGGGASPFGAKSEVVVDADHATAMAFAPDGRLFYAERFTGNIRVITAEGELLEEPFAQVELALYVEWGLSGLALDPDFESNHYVYAFFIEPIDPETPIGKPLVVRFTDQDNQGVNRRVIIGDLPETLPAAPGFNANGSLHFGPDGFLYLSLGDYDTPSLVRNKANPIGKMLRVNKEDGSPAADNPFVDDPSVDPRMFAQGFREPFDFAFHPETGQVYGSDNTPVNCEALNLITAAGNYGWPDVGEFPYSDCQAGEGTKGIHLFAREDMEPNEFLSFVVVSGLEFASGDVYTLWGDSLLVCESETELMRRLVLSGANFDRVAEDDVLLNDCDGDIATSPDGIVYYSNLTEIRRLIPE